MDACQDGCGGIWFDAFELEKMDQPDEAANGLLEGMRVDAEIVPDFAKAIDCPRCEKQKLMRQQYPGNAEVVIDKCQACGGIWLDFGELFLIRSSNPSTVEVRARTAALLSGLRRA